MTSEPTPTYPILPVTTSDKVLMILCHVSPFVGAPFLLPFIVWLVKRKDPDLVAAHAAEALNFHLSYAFYAICCIPLTFILIGVPLMIAIAIASAILAVIGAVRASDGVLYRYPLTIRLVN